MTKVPDCPTCRRPVEGIAIDKEDRPRSMFPAVIIDTVTQLHLTPCGHEIDGDQVDTVHDVVMWQV